VGRSALATAGAEDRVTATDGNGEPLDAGVAGEGEMVGSHATAIMVATRRAARTPSMVVQRVGLRVCDSGIKYYRNCYTWRAHVAGSTTYRSADFSRPAGR
jgi:hypothetical protein